MAELGCRFELLEVPFPLRQLEDFLLVLQDEQTALRVYGGGKRREELGEAEPLTWTH